MIRVLLSLVLLFPSVSLAAVFTDEAAFRASLGAPPQVLDFEEFPNHMQIHDEAFGITFHPAAYVLEIGPGIAGRVHTPPNALINWDSFQGSPIEFTFDEPVHAFGVYNTSWQDQVQLRLYDTAGELVFTGFLPPGDVNFLGYVSDLPIGSGDAVGGDPSSGFIVLDTMMFSTRPPLATQSSSFGRVKEAFAASAQ